MRAVLLLGCGFGAGLCLIVRALRPRAVPLSQLIASLDRPGIPASATPHDVHLADRSAKVARRVLEGVGVDVGRRDRELRVVGRTAERLALEKLVAAVAGASAALLFGYGARSAGLHPPAGLLLLGVLAATAGGFLYPDLALTEGATARRAEFRHALSAYLDLVNVILAGGGGTETALRAAAEAGDGWAFATIREALDRSVLTNRSPWETFTSLSEDLGVEELAELAASAALAGSHGARIRSSLAAKADTLRGHQLAETEAEAEAATERMTIPVAVLLFGFLLFIAWPAVAQITSISSSSVP